MKKILFPLALILAFGCSKEDNRDRSKPLSFHFDLDTVMVDPGEHIIYLQYGLNSSDLSNDQKYLYNFNIAEHLVEVIDLDELVLKERIPFEKEGPNGTAADWPSDFQYLEDNKFLISNFMSIGFFHDAEKEAELKLRNVVFEGDLIEEDEYINSRGVLDEGANTYFSLYQSGFDELRGLAILNRSSNKLKKVPVERLKELEKYSLVFDRGNGMKAARTPSVNLQYHDGKVIISNSATNEILVYYVADDSISVHPFNSNLMNNTQTEVKQKNVGSNEELNSLGKERSKEVSFGNWIYDSVTERHFRFSRQFIKETEDGNEFKLVLTVLDKDFRQIYEIDQLPVDKIGKAFFKNGKIYIFKNMEDELGFMVMTVKEN